MHLPHFRLSPERASHAMQAVRYMPETVRYMPEAVRYTPEAVRYIREAVCYRPPRRPLHR